MQEEVENKVVVLISNCSKLTARELRQALERVLNAHKNRAGTRADSQPHGRMTVKELAAQEKGMQSIEVHDGNIASFNRVARKYGIDFAPFKVKGENRYLVFFKGPDQDAMTAAFKEYTQRQIQRAAHPTILQKLEQFKAQIQHQVKEKVKHREPER